MDEKKLSRLDSTGSVTTLAGGGAFSSFSSLAAHKLTFVYRS